MGSAPIPGPFMIMWLGFKCRECGQAVNDNSADLYIRPDAIVAICKSATICRENRANHPSGNSMVK